MPIILAIEPDRRQAAHLTGIVRQRVSAELILADTTEGALDAIGNRIPDLVLVPALLSPQDDAALAAALRVIAAAAHVRTLTIPVLSNGTGTRTARSGMLAKWMRGRAEEDVPDGCDPAVFAEQINAYLKEAAAEREEQDYAPQADPMEFERTVAPEPDRAQYEQTVAAEEYPTEPEPIEPPAAWFGTVEPDAIEVMAVEPVNMRTVEPIAPRPAQWADRWAQPAAPIDPPAAQWADKYAQPVEPIEPPAARWGDRWSQPAEPAPEAMVEPATDDVAEEWSESGDRERVIDLSEDLSDLGEESIEKATEELADEEELFDGEPVGVYTISATVDEPAVEVLDEADIDLDAFEEDLPEEAVVSQASAIEEAVAMDAAAVDVELAAFEVEVSAVALAASAVDAVDEVDEEDDVEAPNLDIASYVPMYLQTRQMWPPLEGVPVEPPTAKSEHPEGLELVASLRQDIERRRKEPTKPAPMVAALKALAAARPPVEVASVKDVRPVKKQKTHASKDKPAQDEWGFFDPEQCGFSALLAKLDEITEVTDDPDDRENS
jgi:hypothetical protein